MDSPVVVIPHQAMDLVDELAKGFEAAWITDIYLELRVELFLVAVFPRRTLLAAGNPDAEFRERPDHGF